MYYTIYTDEKAPVNKSSRSTHSRWRSLFEEMRVGDWFILPKDHHSRVQQAAYHYLKGRYSLYKHPSVANYYVFLKTK